VGPFSLSCEFSGRRRRGGGGIEDANYDSRRYPAIRRSICQEGPRKVSEEGHKHVLMKVPSLSSLFSFSGRDVLCVTFRVAPISLWNRQINMCVRKGERTL